MRLRSRRRRQSGTPPYLVEILGVAGAGKTTLTHTLLGRGDPYYKGDFIHTRRPADLVEVVRAVPRLAPILAINVVRPPRLSWPDLKLMVYVTRWREVMARRSKHDDGIALLDQGPVYALVRLKAQARGVTASRAFQRWHRSMADLWAGSIESVVWLDAPDDVLTARIDERPQSHTVKRMGADVGQAFVTRYRTLFLELMTQFGRLQSPALIQIDTAQASPDAVAAQVHGILISHYAPRRR